MMNLKPIALTLVLLAAAAGCKDQAAPPPSAEPARPSPEERPEESLSASTRSALDAAFEHYEAIRQTLSNDESDGVAPKAQALAAEAEAAREGATADLKPHLEALAEAARALGEAPAELAPLRKAFGEVSRHLIAVLGAAHALGEGRHVFECTMFEEGYRKWVQSSPELRNPYFGSKMLECGEASSWE